MSHTIAYFPPVLPHAMSRRYRRAMASITRRPGATVGEVVRLLGTGDPAAAQKFTEAYLAGPLAGPPRNRPRARAHNFTPEQAVPAIEGESSTDLQARCRRAKQAERNAAKAQRRARRGAR